MKALPEGTGVTSFMMDSVCLLEVGVGEISNFGNKIKVPVLLLN